MTQLAPIQPQPPQTEAVPPWALRAVEDYPVVHRRRVLGLLGLQPELLDLVLTDGALLILVAGLGFPGASIPRAAAASARPTPSRRDLLTKVGLPPERWVLRVLRKLAPAEFDDIETELIVQVLTDPDPVVRKVLMHQSRLAADTLMTLSVPATRALGSPSLYLEAVEKGEILAGRLKWIHEARAEGGAPRHPAQFGTLRQVRDTCRALVELSYWKPQKWPEEFDVSKDSVVLRGAPDLTLRPIRSAREMSEMSQRFKLCIHVIELYPFILGVGGGEMFHLQWADESGPRHAILWLRLNRLGELVLDELRLPCNDEPPDWLYARVLAWTDEEGREG